MEVVKKIIRMRSIVADFRRQGRTVALVPTMGGLHAGHLSLVRLAKERGAEVVVSIFVNPKQFGEGEDFAEYPRDLTADCELLSKEGVACVFAPAAEEMYPQGFRTSVNVDGLQDVFSGETRQDHFAGVATIVLKLLHVVSPDVAVFGWKDAQQLVIIKRMVEDLNLDVEIAGAPTVREPDGIAASTRNRYLDDEGRQAARALYRALQEGVKLIEGGERSPARVAERVREVLGQEERLTVDYAAAVDPTSLLEPKRLSGLVLVLVSAKLEVDGKPPVILIDNVRVDVPEEKA